MKKLDIITVVAICVAVYAVGNNRGFDKGYTKAIDDIHSKVMEEVVNQQNSQKKHSP